MRLFCVPPRRISEAPGYTLRGTHCLAKLEPAYRTTPARSKSAEAITPGKSGVNVGSPTSSAGLPVCLFLRRPNSIPPHRQIRYVARPRRRHSHLHRRRRRIPRPHAIKEVLHVIDAAIVRRFLLHRYRRHAEALRISRNFVVDLEPAAMQSHRAFRAANHHAAAFDVAEQRAVELHDGLAYTAAPPTSCPASGAVAGAPSRRWRWRAAGVSSFMNHWATSTQWMNRSVMAPPPKSQYHRQCAYWSASKGRSDALPRKRFQSSLEMSTFGRILVRDVVLIPVGADKRHLAQRAVRDQFLGVHVVLPTALLRAGLDHALALLDRGDQRRAFGQRVSDGLFAIHVFAGAHRVDGDRNVPVIRRRDHHRVDILPVEDLAMIGIIRRARGIPRFRAQAMRLVDVAEADDLRALRVWRRCPADNRRAADSDAGDPDALIRAQYAAVRSGGGDGRPRKRRRFESGAPAGFVATFGSLLSKRLANG